MVVFLELPARFWKSGQDYLKFQMQEQLRVQPIIMQMQSIMVLNTFFFLHTVLLCKGVHHLCAPLLPRWIPRLGRLKRRSKCIPKVFRNATLGAAAVLLGWRLGQRLEAGALLRWGGLGCCWGTVGMLLGMPTEEAGGLLGCCWGATQTGGLPHNKLFYPTLDP